MKCPKCGYHSFDYLTKCKKCNHDLGTFKTKFQFRSLIFPHRLNSPVAQPEPGSQPSVSMAAATAATASASTDFGFNFMEEETSPAPEIQAESVTPAPVPKQPVQPAPVAVRIETVKNAVTESIPPFQEDFTDEDESFEEVAPDDSFGLDYEWDNDLPVLNEGQFFDEELTEADEESEWDFTEDAAEQHKKSGQSGAQETSRHPFELRGSGVGDPAPSLLARCLASSIDLTILILATLLFLAAGEYALTQDGPHRLLPSTETLLTLAIPYFLVFFFVCFGYFTLFHFLAGQTPGKMLLRLQVESESGLPLLFSQAFLRSVGGLFSLLPFGLGFFASLFDPRRRGWNDRLAGTMIVALPGPSDAER